MANTKMIDHSARRVAQMDDVVTNDVVGENQDTG